MTDPARLIRETLADATRPCLTSSFQADCVVLIDLVRRVQPDIPILFLDTFHHFPETYVYRDEITARWRLNVITLQAAEPQRGQWQADTRACCDHHKVAPLFAALEQHDLWLTALRRDQSPTRAHLAEVEPFPLPDGRHLRKVSPLAQWTFDDVLAYARTHDIPLLPLYERGYVSIGCAPCTSVPAAGADPRSGRWHGQKLECGIHLKNGV